MTIFPLVEERKKNRASNLLVSLFILFYARFFLQDSHIERRRTKRLHDEVLKEGVKRRRIFHEDVDDEETTSSDFVSTAASTSSEGWF